MSLEDKLEVMTEHEFSIAQVGARSVCSCRCGVSMLVPFTDVRRAIKEHWANIAASRLPKP